MRSYKFINKTGLNKARARLEKAYEEIGVIAALNRGDEFER